MRAANPKADVALTNGGAIRGELAPGPLTYGQLHEVLPFDDGFSAVAMTGAELASVIARNLTRSGSVVVLSGVRAQASCAEGALPAGTRLSAGVLLVKEAGGFVSDYRGQDRMFERREYLAASGELHSRLHKLLAGALR